MSDYFLSSNGLDYYLDDVNRTVAPLPDGVLLWPRELGSPLRSGYAWSKADGRRMTGMEQGPPRIDFEYIEAPTQFSCSFKFTAQQKKRYVDFFNNDLYVGRLPTRIPLIDENGLVYRDVFIASPLAFAMRGSYWTTTLTLVSVD